MLNTKEKTNEQYWDSVQEVLDACCMGWMIRFGTCFNYLRIMGSGHLCDMGQGCAQPQSIFTAGSGKNSGTSLKILLLHDAKRRKSVKQEDICLS